MSGNPFRDPMPGTTYNGFSQSDAPGAPDALGWDDGLRLTRDPADARPRRRGPSRGAMMAGWAAVLGVALGVAYVSQPSRQLDAWADIPPPKSEVPPPPAPEPPRAAPIPAETPQITPAAPAAEAASAAPAADAQAASEVAAATAPAAATPASPPGVAKAQLEIETAEAPAAKPAKPVAHKASADADEPPAKRLRADLHKASSETDEPPARPIRTAARKPAPAKPLVDDARTAGAEAKPADLAALRHRMGQAYAEAVKAGMPRSVLKARQAEWAVLRAKAEDKGPAAVAALYRKRAAQLEALARQAERRRGTGRREG